MRGAERPGIFDFAGAAGPACTPHSLSASAAPGVQEQNARWEEPPGDGASGSSRELLQVCHSLPAAASTLNCCAPRPRARLPALACTRQGGARATRD